MRLTIGNIRSRRFAKMVEIVCIDPHPYYDHILYIQDTRGTFYTLTFQSHEELSQMMLELKDRGSAMAYCELEYSNTVPTYETEDYDRERDPNWDCFEEQVIDYGR